jgi:cephalosporin hydroxylase
MTNGSGTCVISRSGYWRLGSVAMQGRCMAEIPCGCGSAISQRGIITGIDLYDKSALREDRISIYQGDQNDPAFLQEVNRLEGPFDIIIDDGSHVQTHIITSFETLFPLLKTGGIYVIEDTQTSYWTKFEGSTAEMNTVTSAMNYFIKRIHAVNRTEWRKDELHPDLPDEGIDSISFYHNLIFIKKK